MNKTMKVEGPLHVACQCDKCKAQPEQEPVAFLCHGNLFMWPSEDDSCGNPEDHIPLYTTPPQRTWVGLTDGELDDLHRALKIRLMGTFDTKDIYRAIEAKLKEKNT